MHLYKKSRALFPILVALFFFSGSQASAAAPDGLGPWADIVISTNQGLMKDGSAVPLARSDATAAVGVAEGDTSDENFFSLGFGGNIVLGFDNGISSGVFVVEATNPDYPLEQATVEVSEDGTTWMVAGTVVQDGTVTVPEGITCAKFIRITDISDPVIMPDQIADGYDVDGAQAIGDSCTLPTPPTPSPSPSGGGGGGGGGGGTPAPSPSGAPGFPDTGSSSCIPPGSEAIPDIVEVTRINATSIFASWSPSGSLSDFIVQYGFQSDNLENNIKVSGLSTTITGLPANRPVWIHIAAIDNCLTVGGFGVAGYVSGGSLAEGDTATITAPSPNIAGSTTVPGFPDTGISPEAEDQDIPWVMAIIVNSLLFYVSYRAYKFLSIR